MLDIDRKIESWRNCLLDLGKRNRLITCPDPKQGGRISRLSIAILKPEADTLWAQFAEDKGPLVFPLPPDSAQESKGVELIKGIVLSKISDTITNQSAEETQKTLRNLKRKARESIEEKGLNVLYLAFGFLNWRENNETGGELRSPLLLVPVQLSQKDIFSSFELSRFDDEIMPNKALHQKLLNDFGVELPDYSDEIDFKEYIAEVRRVCASMKCTVTLETELSLFSFLKIAMYQDLGNNADKIKQHPVVKILAGENTDAEYPDSIGFDHDAAEPQKVFSVLDADSSQQDAVQLAKRGVSFILKGPPGTGKSQTIVNIIAELLSDGKRVLFVSDKMAALEVVHKRLSAAGLKDFCLPLHSHNAKRREILDQLEGSLKIAQNQALLTGSAFDKLAQLKRQRELLNQYSRELHTVVEPLGKTIFYVNGKIAALDSVPNIEFSLEDAAKYSPADLAEKTYLLAELSRIVAESGWQTDNPWQGCTLTHISNEFRQRFLNFVKLANEGQEIYSAIASLFGSAENYRYTNNQFLTETLTIAAHSPNVSYAWMSVDIAAVYPHLAECEKYHSLRDELMKNRDDTKNAVSVAIKKLDEARTVRDEYLRLYTATNQTWVAEHEKYSGNYDDSIFDIDAETMLIRFRTEYRSILRIFKRKYKAARNTILACKKTADNLSYADILILLDGLSAARKIRLEYETRRNIYEIAEKTLQFCENTYTELSKKTLEIDLKLIKVNAMLDSERQWLKDILGFDFSDNTDYTSLKNRIEWARQFGETAKTGRLSNEYVKCICACDTSVVSQSENLRDRLKNWIEISQESFKTFAEWFEQPLWLKPMLELSGQVKNLSDNFSSLEYYIDYRSLLKKSSELGVDRFIFQASRNNLPAVDIVPAFEKCFYRAWLDAVLPNYNAVQTFRRLKQEDRIKEFKKLDTLHIEIAKETLISKLISQLPDFDSPTSKYDELGLLKRELNKQRKLMPARKLIADLPNLLPKLKPCMMMSPLSVSTYLGGGYEFDAVIFDEASQVRTEDAIGAIFRGKQTIIAGDSNQLPPSDFFRVSLREKDTDIEDEETAEVGAFNSLLDEAALLPSLMLKWHYRSRHEDLIAFSNAKIYEGELITFPSAVETTEDLGVSYVYVSNGIYDRDGENGNPIEAEKVAELAFEHFHKNPERSLGIIAFGSVQQTAILDALDRKRKLNQSFEQFFREDLDEPIFIKNLETVQGDERDTIIFSIGYARDATGKFLMNFGPLTKTGGERRLNVAVTRARYNLKLVGSIQPADIDTERIKGMGPKLLRLYIDFAINGAKAILGEITESREPVFDSPFEKAVYNFLTTHGYDAATQVGCSRYRIDIAIRHPNYPGRFAIGIECDGAAYHSARTARERDRLRQAVLEDMGWTIYRVWSTDWIKDPKTEGEKLLNAVKEAIANYHETATPPQKPVPTPDDLTVSDNPETNTELQQTDFAEAAVQLELDMPEVTQETLKQAFSMLNAKERDHKHEKTYKEKCRSLYKDLEAIKDILNTGTVDAETKRQFQAVTLAIQTL
ncbi:MAG: DUF4011 domain-containing protein [Spirochaetaceae bacterium]|jgi:very-short-patch-repair endonuclease|nr:DUF4011 domain-containing protein [Spirochaetaceae bacterium]